MVWSSSCACINRWVHIACNQFWVRRQQNKRPMDEHAQGIVIIKLDAIGDFLIWLDSASYYPRLFEGQKITLICNKACEEIAKQTKYFDEVIAIENKRFETEYQYRKQVLEMLGQRSFQILLQPAFSRTIDMDLLACSIPAAEKIAFTADESRINLSRFLAFPKTKKILDSFYDKRIPATQECMMEAKRNAEFIRGLGGNCKAGFSQLPRLEATHELIPHNKYVVIFPGASSDKKMWSASNFAYVISYIAEHYAHEIIVCGSKSESRLYEDIVNALQKKEIEKRIQNYCGKTSLVELAEIVRNADLVISNDTSGIHYAAAVNTTGICLFGDFAYGRFLPYDLEKEEEHNPIMICHADMPCKGCSMGKMTKECKKHLLHTGRYLCMDNIAMDSVIEKIRESL